MPSNSSPEPTGPSDVGGQVDGHVGGDVAWDAVRARFVLPRAPDGSDAVYLAGNSLGALPRAVADRSLVDEWATLGVGGWEAGWWDLPHRLGDRLAPWLGADPGTVIVGDSTSVQLYQALVAAARLRPDRSVLLGDAGHFPTDRYLAASVARTCGLTLRTASPPAMRPDGDTAAVAVPAVDFRTGERWDLARVVDDAHAAGALVVVDLSHAVGAMPVGLGSDVDADLAVGCTYKYLNGGPGAPAFAWVAPRWSSVLDPPLTGWTGHARPFAMEEAFAPADGVGRLRVGTPPILSMLALRTALDVLGDVPLDAIRRRSLELGDAFLDALPPDADVVTPRSHEQRGAHVAVRVDDAERRCAELARRGVIVDARPPDLLRVGFAAPYVSMADATAAARAMTDAANAR